MAIKITTKQRRAIADQVTLSESIARELNICLVTCIDCGLVLLIDMTDEESTCPHCGTTDEGSAFPDLFFKGMSFVTQQERETNE